eukprot:702414-Prorocentrum_minimum.AAC.2
MDLVGSEFSSFRQDCFDASLKGLGLVGWELDCCGVGVLGRLLGGAVVALVKLKGRNVRDEPLKTKASQTHGHYVKINYKY